MPNTATYKIVVGTPLEVEAEVNKIIGTGGSGWFIDGGLCPVKGGKVAQVMLYYEEWKIKKDE